MYQGSRIKSQAKKTINYLLFRLVVLLVLTLLLPTTNYQLLTVSADDWSQFRKDAQRSAATNEQINGSLVQKWKRGFNEWPHVFAELIVVNNRVYFANMDGKLTVMDGNTGNTVWEFDTGSPIPTTPAVGNGKVHVVNIKGRLMTFDLNGTKLWEYTVPSDVYGSPLLVANRIFFGTVGGIFYAFDTTNGGSGPVWTYDTGAMIDTSPVEVNGKVIFGAENMKAIALNSTTGTVVWTANLPGSRSWNGHPVASVSKNRVYFSTIFNFDEQSSTFREVFNMYEFESRTGVLSDMLSYADSFISANRSGLTPAVVLDVNTGQPITSYTVSPNNNTIGGLPTASWYWGSIRPALWQGDKLFLQSMWRNILLDFNTNRLYQPNSNQNRTMHFVRGDEQVPISIGGDRAYGVIGQNVAYLDLTTGTRGNFIGSFGTEVADATPLTAPLSANHYTTFPGDGYSDRNGTLIASNGKVFFTQYGWVYAYDASISAVGPSPTPAPTAFPNPSGLPSPSPVPSVSPSPSAAASASPSVAPSPSPLKPGDIDGNNKVDIFDYNILLTNFGKTGTGIQGDLDSNNKVDIFDYNILLTNFGK